GDVRGGCVQDTRFRVAGSRQRSPGSPGRRTGRADMTIASRIQALPAWHHLVFRPITKADVDVVADLYFRCFGVRRPPAYIRWRYLETPTGLTPTMLAFDKGECVGCYALWPTGLLLDGRHVAGGQAIDSMTHPDYRGRGLFVEVAERCYDNLRQLGYQVLYGF